MLPQAIVEVVYNSLQRPKNGMETETAPHGVFMYVIWPMASHATISAKTSVRRNTIIKVMMGPAAPDSGQDAGERALVCALVGAKTENSWCDGFRPRSVCGWCMGTVWAQWGPQSTIFKMVGDPYAMFVNNTSTF